MQKSNMCIELIIDLFVGCSAGHTRGRGHSAPQGECCFISYVEELEVVVKTYLCHYRCPRQLPPLQVDARHG